MIGNGNLRRERLNAPQHCQRAIVGLLDGLYGQGILGRSQTPQHECGFLSHLWGSAGFSAYESAPVSVQFETSIRTLIAPTRPQDTANKGESTRMVEGLTKGLPVDVIRPAVAGCGRTAPRLGKVRGGHSQFAGCMTTRDRFSIVAYKTYGLAISRSRIW